MMAGGHIGYQTSNVDMDTTRIYSKLPENDDSINIACQKMILDADDGFQHVRVRKFIYQDFADIIKNITKNFTSPIWTFLKATPLLTHTELLWLKVDDVDSRVEHRENGHSINGRKHTTSAKGRCIGTTETP